MEVLLRVICAKVFVSRAKHNLVRIEFRNARGGAPPPFHLLLLDRLSFLARFFAAGERASEGVRGSFILRAQPTGTLSSSSRVIQVVVCGRRKFADAMRS